MGALWAAICASRLGRWVAGLALTIAGLGALLLVTYGKGRRKQADEDKAARVEEQAAFDRLAHQTQTDAAQSAARVQQDAAKQPPPDTVKRNDFNTSF